MDASHSGFVEKAYQAFFSPHKHEAQQKDLAVLNRGVNFKIQVDRGELAVTSWGTGGDQILLMHGWGGARAQMTGFVDPLLSAGYRVVAYDQPAHGDSDGTMTNILEIGVTMDLIRQRVGDFKGIIAHSFGTLITSHALVNLDLPAPQKLVYFGSFNRLLDAIPRFQAIANLSDEIVSGMSGLMSQNFDIHMLETLVNEEMVKKINVPALMYHDINDEVTPVGDSRAIAAAWQHARYVETSGLGHRGALQSPDIHDQVVAFLSGG